MRIAVCDDMPEDRQNMRHALDSVVKNFTLDEFCDGKELLRSHAAHPYDVIFLDIIMPNISGMDTAAHLRRTDTKTPIVFVSTTEEFGVQSYRVQAFDYLLKPVDVMQLRACLNRLFFSYRKKHFVTINYLGSNTEVLISNIQCLESNLRKVIFTLADNREIEVSGKLADFEDYLLRNGFCRCHKSYLVNIEHVEKIDGDTFELSGGKSVKISRTHLADSKKAYFDYIFSLDMSRE